jgi:AcrR family transcriptional regulator
MRQKGQRTKQKIFDTAMALIKERTFSEVTVSEICERAGVAKGTFYIYYVSKDDLIYESYTSEAQGYIGERFEKYLQSHPNASYESQLRAYMHIELDFVEHTGSEVVNLAYTVNHTATVNGVDSDARQEAYNRLFRTLVDASDVPMDKDLFFFESRIIISGLMSTWGLMNGKPEILSGGHRMLDDYLDKAYRQ